MMISVSPASNHMGCSGGSIPWLSNYVVALTNQGELVNTKDQERSLLWILGAIYAAVIEHAGWKNIFCQLADFFKVNASVPVCSHTDVKCYCSPSILAIALVCLLPYHVEAASLPDACGPVIVIEPHTSKTSDSRPNLAWEPIPGASAYRIKLDSRIPEGEKVFSAEVQVSTTSFLPANRYEICLAIEALLIVFVHPQPVMLGFIRG
jgi:hypothetical protein